MGRAPSSLRSLQTKKDVKISYSAHVESHKKFDTLNLDNAKMFKPKILNTPASSKLIQSRNYQPPKKVHVKKRIVRKNILKYFLKCIFNMFRARQILQLHQPNQRKETM